MLITLSKNIYVCKNIYGCKAAYRHELTLASAGIALLCPKCNCTLTDTGKKKYNYLALFASITFLLLVALSAWLLVPVINPSKLQQIQFEHTLTRVNEADAMVQVTITITSVVEEKRIIEYSLLSGTATGGEDFNDQPGQLVVLPGQKQGVISIPIIPDRNVREVNETFEIVLSNVEGMPRHTVLIEEEGLNKESLEISDVLIAELSRLAADIANDYAAIKMLENYLRNSLKPDEKLIERYEQARSNILHARERYLLQFNEALNLDPVVIDMSIRNRLAAIKRNNAELQYKATLQMQTHLNEYMSTRIPQTDLWIEDLGMLVLPSLTDVNKKTILKI